MARRPKPDFATLTRTGKGTKGVTNPSFKSGRYSRYLPANLDRLYREALSNPDLIDMADHIALLEAHMQDILLQAKSGDPVPLWADIRELFADIETALLSAKPEVAIQGMERMHRLMDSGDKWDQTWIKVVDIMEQLRRMTDTEVKRRKDLHQMIPVERVVILMAAVATAVKRHVKDPEEVMAVYRELAVLHGTDRVPAYPGQKMRVGADPVVGSIEVIDVGEEIVDEAIEAKRRREYRELSPKPQPWKEPAPDATDS